jgi:SAM-dependent methyltransferase
MSLLSRFDEVSFMENNDRCQICGNFENNQYYDVREMMFGYRDEFKYFECSKCGCLQIKKIPENITKFYPKNYFAKPNRKLLKRDGLIKSWLMREKTKYLLYQKSILGKLVSLVSKIEPVPVFTGWNWVDDLRNINLGLDAAILDVGGGHGSLLYYLRKQGFSNLIGVDPYIEEKDIFSESIKIYKKELKNLDDQFDFIMLHHSFEHMSHPKDIFEQLYRLLKPQRYLLIRIPVASSFAWKKYGVNWAQLDAPRHFFLHTPESIQILANKVGFEIVNVIYDSTEFQFWVSEQYLRDIPLKEKSNTKNSIFSAEEIEAFKTEAEKLNSEKQGDQACFYLYKP